MTQGGFQNVERDFGAVDDLLMPLNSHWLAPVHVFWGCFTRKKPVIQQVLNRRPDMPTKRVLVLIFLWQTCAAEARSSTWGLVLSTSGACTEQILHLEAVLDGARRAFKGYCSKGSAKAFLRPSLH